MKGDGCMMEAYESEFAAQPRGILYFCVTWNCLDVSYWNSTMGPDGSKLVKVKLVFEEGMYTKYIPIPEIKLQQKTLAATTYCQDDLCYFRWFVT